MNRCIICHKEFEPPKNYTEKKTCSKKCFQLYMKTKPTKKFLKNSFKKGHKTHNKGIPRKEWMSSENINKCSKTHIQYQDCKSPLSEIEGRYLPYNTLEKGTVTRRLNKHKKVKMLVKQKLYIILILIGTAIENLIIYLEGIYGKYIINKMYQKVWLFIV